MDLAGDDALLSEVLRMLLWHLVTQLWPTSRHIMSEHVNLPHRSCMHWPVSVKILHRSCLVRTWLPFTSNKFTGSQRQINEHGKHVYSICSFSLLTVYIFTKKSERSALNTIVATLCFNQFLNIFNCVSRIFIDIVYILYNHIKIYQV